jgi:CBS-domain-containing membrane protein
MVGVVRAEQLRAAGHAREGARRAPRVGELVVPPMTVAPHNTLLQAWELLGSSRDLHELVVVDAHNRVLGVLDQSDLARAYRARVRS